MGASSSTCRSSSNSETVYAVILYPPVGKPRVVSLPAPPPGFNYPMATFSDIADAQKALQQFLLENPEYKTWENGSLHLTNGE